ncbi:glycosyltransferase family protein [Albibacterium bauzanense]|uniref:Oligosaccharide biosynthesis protein Alg14 n=1 Tax=Albibacterium bauzanense TaxID=653929 RepID=A0A4R1LZE3_9SPHI|nr:oligosaccharide biosynthesis protein Alg14 [Albibacterium bauzanense]TCK84948.1 oligosaccharide biosynthesis protein Alg14 [Albibacterium bauzanense]
MSKKIIAIASAGGHWIQLLRIAPAFENNEVVFVSTEPSFASSVKNFDYYLIPDASRWDKIGLLKSFYSVFKMILKLKPEIIITTGAAPGLMAIIVGRIIGCKTIWIDSIANVDKISMSGKIALRFANIVYTQWPELVKGKIVYHGNVIS